MCSAGGTVGSGYRDELDAVEALILTARWYARELTTTSRGER
jgi:hypothetical protein